MTQDYVHHLRQKEMIGDFLNEFCEKASYTGEIFDISPKELLMKFIVYYDKRTKRTKK